MKLYYGAGACSMGIHIILEEIGKPYDTQRFELQSGDTRKPPFIELNPKGKVPTLQRDDGSIVTEFPVIAHYLAETNPEANLLPKDKEAMLRAAEAMDYCVATIHMQGFARMIRPSNFAPSESDHEKVKAQGKEMVEKGFKIMADKLGGQDWVGGTYSVADTALFYVEYWGVKRAGMTLPPPLAAHFDRMLARPAVKRMIEAEGLPA